MARILRVRLVKVTVRAPPGGVICAKGIVLDAVGRQFEPHPYCIGGALGVRWDAVPTVVVKKLRRIGQPHLDWNA